jgi:hypothetical protein
MWFLAVVGVVLRRRAGRTVLALAMLAFSPFVMLVLLAYGQEGVLRVYLFSLPWTAALAALALAPFPSVAKLATYGAAKRAQALATTLWVPRNGSSGTDDTVIFDRKAADRVRKATALAGPAAVDDTTQPRPRTRLAIPASPAGPSEAAETQPRPSAAPAPRPKGSSDLDGTVVFSPLGAAGMEQAATPAGTALPAATGSNRRLTLSRQGRQIMVLLCLHAAVFIAGIIAVVVLRG